MVIHLLTPLPNKLMTLGRLGRGIMPLDLNSAKFPFGYQALTNVEYFSFGMSGLPAQEKTNKQ